MKPKRPLRTIANAALCVITCAGIGSGLLLELRMNEADGSVRLFGSGQENWDAIHVSAAVGSVALTVFLSIWRRAWIKAMLIKAKWAVPLLGVGLGLGAALLYWPADPKVLGGDPEPGQHAKEED